jgi:hypothetical protein
MFRLFKRPIERQRVINDIIELHLNQLLQRNSEIIGVSTYESIDQVREAAAFVYVVGIFGIQASRLRPMEKHRFSMELTQAWSDRLMMPGWKATLFLQERLKEYRAVRQPIELAQRYMQHLDLCEDAVVLTRITLSIKLFELIRRFINDVSRKHKFV